MPKTINAEGIGPVNFPDDATDEDILQGLNDLAPGVEKGQRLRQELASVRQEPAALSSPNAPAPSPVSTFQGASETTLMPAGEEYRQFRLPRAGALGIEPVTTFQGPSEVTLQPEQQARTTGEIMQNAAAAGIEGLVSPMTPPIVLGTIAAPEVAIPLLTATMAKSGSAKLAEGIVDLEQGRHAEGVAKIGEAGTELGFAGAPALHPSLFSGRSMIEMPESLRALAEEPSTPEIEPLRPFLPARVQPGERAGIPVPTIGEAMTRPGLPTQPKPPPVEVPGTAPEARETVIETIRNADARTLAQIQALFPEAKLSREQARVFRNIAFPPVQEPVRPQATAAEVLGRPPGTLPPEAPPTSAEEAAIQEQLRTEQPGIATVEPPAPTAADVITAQIRDIDGTVKPFTVRIVGENTIQLENEATGTRHRINLPSGFAAASIESLKPLLSEGVRVAYSTTPEHGTVTTLVRDPAVARAALPAPAAAPAPELTPAPAEAPKPAPLTPAEPLTPADVARSAYTPAVRFADGRVVAGPAHDVIAGTGGRTDFERGYVDRQGQFLSLMEVARREMASRTPAEQAAAPAARAEEAPAAPPVEPPKPAAAPAPAPEPAPSGAEPIRMSFEQFQNAPREGRLLDELRKVPKREKTPEQVAAAERDAKATEAVEKAKLGWIFGRSGAEGKMVEAAIRKLPKTKKKLVDEYEAALTAKIKADMKGQEGRQRELYDALVAKGVIEPPAPPPAPGAEPTEAATPPAATETPSNNLKADTGTVASARNRYESAIDPLVREFWARELRNREQTLERVGGKDKPVTTPITISDSDMAHAVILDAVNRAKVKLDELFPGGMRGELASRFGLHDPNASTRWESAHRILAAKQPSDLFESPAPVAEVPKPAPTERTIPLINLRESEATPMALGKIKARDPERWANIVKFFKSGDAPGAIAKAAQAKIDEMKARAVPEPPKADVGKPEEPPPPQTTQYGMMMPGVEMLLGEMPGKTVSPTSEPFWNTERSFSQNISGVAGWIRDLWRGFAMKQAPKITDSNRAAGESGVRYAASHLVARAKGLEFGATVLRDTGVEPKKFGVALSEDNLRSIKDSWTQEAASATAAGNADAAALAQDKADAVRTLIGAERSPFKTEAEYQAFLNDPAVKTAIARHIQLWQEQKDPLFRQANDLDPDVPLAGRGKQTGARINLKALASDEKGVAVVGGRPAKLRQLATKLRRDPFARRATGGGQAYEGDYNELMAHGFGTEYPIAAQHQFIKALIEAGDAKVTDMEFPKDLTIKGEKPVANILRLNPWRGKFLQVRRSLVDEYRAISNLDEPWKIPILTPFNDLMTKQSIQGFAEGSTHTSNLMMEIFTGLGPTNNPLLNGLIKSVGRADLLYSVPRVIIKAFQDTKPEMLRLAESGMAKEPYQGKMLGRILNGADRGVRLVSEQIYDGMAEKGWVENTETGKREFINQIGNYNKRLQPSLIRKLRDTGIQPFATAMQTFNVMGLRRLVGAPGAKATSNMAALALRADIAGGFIGFVALTTYLNYLFSGNAAGPKGTPLGAVGWKDEHGKTHFFNVGRLLGYERGARITGLGPYMEARRNGLTHEQALQAGGRSVASTVMSYPAGPGPRALYTVGTGMRMNQPTVREAPAVPPTESLNPFKTQLAKNIQTAVIEANPAISSLHDLREGKSTSDIAEKQFGRYTPREGKSEGFYRALPKIVTKGQLIDYADDVVKEARKLPISQRMSYIQTRFNKDDLKAQYRNDVMTEIKRKGVLRYQ